MYSSSASYSLAEREERTFCQNSSASSPAIREDVVEGGMLFARGALDRAHDAAADTEVREILEAHAALFEIGNGQIQPDHALLNEVFRFAAFQKKAARAAADGVFVLFEQGARGGAVSALCGEGELFVRHLLCLTASYAATPKATDALRELTLPFNGRERILSHFFFVRAETPLFSPPTTSATSPVRSQS